MASATSRLKRASWNGIEFPVRRYSVKGSLRHHVHEFPHAWGGAFENLQRKLYEIRMTVPMMATFRNYPNLWPTKWLQMRKQFETGEPGPLHIPTIGTIQARCTEWPEDFDAKNQSGVMVELSFIEDKSQQFLAEKTVEVDKQRIPALIDSATGEWQKAVDRYKNGTTKYQVDLFDSVISFARDILSFKDNVEYYGQFIESKVAAFDAVVREADAAIQMFDDPENWALVNAVRDLWQSIKTFADDVAGTNTKLETWVVPMTMSVADISTRLYGNNSMAVTILQTNAIDDAFAVTPGFQIRYYPDVTA